MKQLKTFIIIIFAVMFLTASPAYAYIDPGAGAMLSQILIGGVAGLMFILKLYSVRIKLFFKEIMYKNAR